MDLEKLFELQQILDKKIVEQHSLKDASLTSRKILALQVELGELANETRCFKYWSNKSPSSKETILEEYVDCLHFILTLGIEKKYTDIKLNLKHCEFDLTSQFINLFVDVNDFVVCSSKDNYITLFNDFISLGSCLNFSLEDIENAYLKKNKVNHKRQNEGY